MIKHGRHVSSHVCEGGFVPAGDKTFDITGKVIKITPVVASTTAIYYFAMRIDATGESVEAPVLGDPLLPGHRIVFTNRELQTIEEVPDVRIILREGDVIPLDARCRGIATEKLGFGGFMGGSHEDVLVGEVFMATTPEIVDRTLAEGDVVQVLYDVRIAPLNANDRVYIDIYEKL